MYTKCIDSIFFRKRGAFMYCNKCNQNNPAGAAFCAFCGASLTQQQSGTMPPTVTPIYTPDISTPHTPTTQQQPPFYPQAPGPQENSAYCIAQSAHPTKKFKKALLIIPAALLCIVLVGFLVTTLVISASPQYQVIDGITNTLEEFEGSLESADTFHKIYENLYECISDNQLSAELHIQSDDDVDAHIFLDYSQPDKLVSLSGNVQSDYNDYDFTVAATQKKLLLQLCQLNNNFYSIPLKNFGKEFKNSELADLIRDQFTYFMDYSEFERALEKVSIDLFADTSFDSFRDTYDDFDDWVTNLDIKEVDYTIPHTRDLTVYRAEIVGRDLARILVKYTQFRYEQILGKAIAAELELDDLYEDAYEDLEDSILIVYFGINDDDCLAAFYGYEEGNKDDSFSFVLSGRKNIWDEVTLYDGDREMGGFCINETSNGFIIECFDTNHDGERDVELTLECDEDAGQLIISEDYDEFVVNFSQEGAYSVLSFDDESDDVRFTAKIASFDGAKFPEGKEISLFECTLDDFIDLGRDIESLFD